VTSADLPALERAVRAVCTGLRRAAVDGGPVGRVIVCLLRGSSMAEATTVARCAVEQRSNGVVGIDVAGDETAYPDIDHLTAMLHEARAEGLGVTVHAGETGNAAAVRDAIEHGASRLGHGLAAAEDPGLLREIQERGVTIECCPTSNIKTGLVDDMARHPIWTFLQAGISVAVGDDDPVTVSTDIGREFARLRAAGLTDTDDQRLRTAAINAAFDRDAARRACLDDNPTGLGGVTR
jgi:adenosine deaminase